MSCCLCSHQFLTSLTMFPIVPDPFRHWTAASSLSRPIEVPIVDVAVWACSFECACRSFRCVLEMWYIKVQLKFDLGCIYAVWCGKRTVYAAPPLAQMLACQVVELSSCVSTCCGLPTFSARVCFDGSQTCGHPYYDGNAGVELVSVQHCL